MNSREEGFKEAFVEGMDYESATQSNWKTKEGGAINLSPCGSLGIIWRLKDMRSIGKEQPIQDPSVPSSDRRPNP